MSNVDPRMELARQIAANRRPQPVAPLAVGPKTAGPRPTRSLSSDPETRALQNRVDDATTTALRQFPTLTDRINAAAAGKAEPKGVGGLFGRILSSTPAKIALQPLIVLDTGRRAVISGVREFADWADSDPKTKASLDDFMRQTRDPAFGFGTAFPMKGNFGRFVGFVGDVGLDPLTYATLGVGKASTGLANRIALSGKYLTKFDDAAKAAKIAQYGKAALNAEEIERLGLKRSGVYFFGERVRMPLSGPIGEAMLSGLTKTRVGITNTRFGRAFQKGFIGMGGDGNKSLRDIRLALARGEALPDNMPVEAGIKIVNSENSRRAVANMAYDAVRRRVATELGNTGSENLNKYRNVAYKWLEGTAVPQTAQEQVVFERFKGLFESLWDDINNDFVRLSPDSKGLEPVKQYFPWVMTEDAKRLTTDMETPWVKNLMSYLAPSPLDKTGSFRSRGLKAGAEFLWTVDDQGVKTRYILKPEDLNIERLNEIARGALGVDFWETDLEKVLLSYSNSYAQQKGLLAMYDDLYKSGVITEMTRRGVVDEEAVLSVANAADNAAKNIVDGMASAGKRLQDAAKLVSERAQQEVDRLSKAAVDANAAASVAEAAASPTAEAALLGEAIDAATVVGNLRGEIESLKGSLDFLFDEVPPGLQPMYDSYDLFAQRLKSVESRIKALNEERAMLELRSATVADKEGVLGRPFYEQLKELEDEMKRTADELATAATNHQVYMELNNVLRSRFDDIIGGTSPRIIDGKIERGTMPKEVPSRIKSIIKGSQRKLPKGPEGVAGSIEDFGLTPGRFDTWMRGKDNPAVSTPWFQKAQEYLGRKLFSKNRISRMSYKQVVDTAVRAAPTYSDGIELLHAAAYLLSRDLKFYGSASNPVLVEASTRLETAMSRVSDIVGLINNRGRVVVDSSTINNLNSQIEDIEFSLRFLYSQNLDKTEILDDIQKLSAVSGRTATDSDWAMLSDVSVQYLGDLPDDATVDEIIQRLQYASDDFDTLVSDGYTVNDIPSLENKVQKLTSKREAMMKGKLPEGLKNLDMNALMATAQEQIGDLANQVTSYALLSEVNRRFTAVAMDMTPFGLVPDEGLLTIIIRRVGEDFMEKTVSREAAVLAVRDEMNAIRSAVMQEMGAKGTWLGTFEDMLQKAYDGPNGAAMLEVMGPIVLYSSDVPRIIDRYRNIKANPGRSEYLDNSRKFVVNLAKAEGEEIDEAIPQAQVRKRLEVLAESENDAVAAKAIELLEADAATKQPMRDFMDETLLPWYEEAYPSRKFNLKEAQRLSKASPARSERNMRVFLTELLGGHYKSGASYAEKVGRNRWSRKGFVSRIVNKSPGGEYIAAHVEGSISTELRVLRDRVGRLMNMQDPSADIYQFLNDPFGVDAGPLSLSDFYMTLSSQLKNDVEKLKPFVKPIVQAEKASATVKQKLDDIKRVVELMNPRDTTIDPRTNKVRETVAQYSERIQRLLDEVDPTNSRPFVAPNREDIVAAFVPPTKKPKESYKAYEARVAKMKVDWDKSQEPKYMRAVAEARKVWQTEIEKSVGDLHEFYMKQSQMASDYAAIRKVRETYGDFIASPEYVAAKRDENVTNMMIAFASVDGWKVSHPITGEPGWFLSPQNPNVSFDGLFSDLFAEDYEIRKILLNEQNAIRVMQPVNIDNLAGAELNDVYIVSPNKKIVFSADRASMRRVNQYFSKLRRFVADVEKSGGVSSSNMTTEMFVQVQQAKKMLDDWDSGRWTYSRFGKFEGKKNHNVDDLIYLGADPSSALRKSVMDGGFVTPSQNLEMDLLSISNMTSGSMPAREAMPNVFERFTSPRATYVDDESLASRKQIADLLLQQGRIDDSVHYRLVRNKMPIDRVLNSTVNVDGAGQATIEDLIGPAAASALREADKPISFSREEWLSIYEPPTVKRLGQVNSQIGQLNKRLQGLNELLAKGQATVTVDGSRVNIATEIRRVSEELAELRVISASGRKSTQQAALEKMDQLYSQIEPSPDASARKVATRRNAVVENARVSSAVNDSSLITRRKNTVRGQWEQTDSYRTISTANEIKNSPEMIRFRETDTARANLVSASKAAEAKAKELRNIVSSVEGNIVDILQTVQRDMDKIPFSEEGVVVYDKVKEIVQSLLKQNKDGVQLDIAGVRASLPNDIKRMAQQIAEGYVSPQERNFVKKLTGTSTIGEMWTAAFAAARAKSAYSALSSAIDNDPTRLNEILGLLIDKRPKGTPKGAPLTVADMQYPVIVRDQLVREMRALEEEITKSVGAARKQAQGRYKKVLAELGVKEDDLNKALVVLTDIQGRYESILPNLYTAEEGVRYANSFVLPKIQELQDLLTRAQAVGVGGRKKIVTPETYMDIAELVDDFKRVMNDLKISPDDPINKVFLDAVNAQTEMMSRMATLGQVQAEFIGNASFVNFERQLDKGYKELTKSGLKGLQAPGEVVDFFENMRRLKDPLFQREVMNFLQKYTKFFKSYATLSPGFHVRNAMSNTFALVAAGANPVKFAEGLRMYTSMREAFEAGLDLDGWLASLPEARRATAEVAAKSMFASGGGITSDAMRGMSRRNKGIRGAFEDNFLLSTSRSIGGRLESSARFMLGYDSALNGLDLNQASARVRRYMVDYEDVGKADEVMRTIIPFWMWTSRALPMHLMNQWMNPRPYAIYNSFKRNYMSEDESEITPGWITEQGGFRIGKNTYLMPDLGFNRLGQQVTELGDPMRLLSQANPLIRLPIELAGGKKLYTGQPLSEEPQQVEGGISAMLQPLLQIAGYGQTTPDGKKFVDERALYALQNLVPFLAQGERLLPSTETGQEKQFQSLLGYLGVPVRQIGERQQRGELMSRLAEINKIIAEGRAMQG